MKHPLEVKLRRYRFWARVYSTLTVAGYLCSVMAIVLLLLGTIDWYARPTDSVFRLVLWILALAPLLYVPVSLYRAARRSRSNVELAGDLEKAIPRLHNWLAGAIDFLQVKKEGPTAGSKELRDAVIQRATQLAEDFDFSQTLNRRPVYRAIGTMAFSLGLILLIVTINPQVAWTASQRLTQPLVPIPWPSKTMLTVKQSPERLIRGNSFQAVLVDEQDRKLPEVATVFYRFKQTDEKTPGDKKKRPLAIETETIRTDGRQILLYRDQIDRSFSYRVVAGDDERMPWQEVTVVEPPAVESLVAEVTPPAYVGDDTPITVPVTDQTCVREGSRVQLIARVTKPVRQATLLLGENEYEGQVDEQGRRIIFPIGLFDTSTMADYACTIGFVLQDQYELEVKVDQSQQLELIENRPPSVTILRPVAGEQVVVSSIVQVDAQVEDDLGVRSVVMHWTIEGATGIRSLVEPIYEGPEKLSFKKDASQNIVGVCPAKGQKLTAQCRWDLWPLKLRVDDRLSLRVVATDYSGIRTASEPVEIVVVDSATFVNRLVSEQRAITDEMTQTLAISRRNLRRMNQVRDQLEKSDEVQIATLDLLRAVMLDRRQVVRTLTDKNDGLIARSSSILNQLNHSRLRVSSLRCRLVRLIHSLEQLRTDILPQIEQNVTQATKNAEQAVDPESRITIEMAEILSPLALAIHGQERLIGRLEAMLGRLDDVVDYQRFYNELKRLVQSEGELIEETKALGRSLLGRVAADLRPSERTRLEQTARRQSLLARESGQVVTRMVEAADRVADADGNRLAQTVASPTARSLGATLTRAAEAIAQNQLGRAVKLQTESLAELESMLKQMTQVTDTTTTDPNAQQVNIDETPDPNETGQQEPGQNQNDPSGEDPSGPAGNQTVQKMTFDSEGKPIQSTHLKPKAVDNLIERLWGELPDRDHQRLLQLPGERFLPGYERQIEEYYKRLLEQ